MSWIESYFVIRFNVILNYAIITLIASSIMLFAFSFLYVQEKLSDAQGDVSFLKSLIKIFLISCIVSILILMLIPTTEECLAIKNLQNNLNNEDILNINDGPHNRFYSIDASNNTDKNK